MVSEQQAVVWGQHCSFAMGEGPSGPVSQGRGWMWKRGGLLVKGDGAELLPPTRMAVLLPCLNASSAPRREPFHLESSYLPFLERWALNQLSHIPYSFDPNVGTNEGCPEENKQRF